MYIWQSITGKHEKEQSVLTTGAQPLPKKSLDRIVQRDCPLVLTL